ncbi:hypothetical protein [Streptomyces sp. VRA16 Mangrove soil]|uniref:hypothetical protein n=1 Tax=Streptomyces sp. VRA16 Mangrove soil TaxID=2817434 RepID=UPI001A9D8D81|nr:hypothetical protein [Streptomyces sp. VRA16 Mangrove soil]MBO1336460.1 hypothetical protein [Streptomyces sp. VRA16 Mangrove soil]
MTSSAPAAARDSAPQSREWIGPLLSTVVTLPGAFVAHFFAGLSAMACDSCTDAQLATFDPSFDRGFSTFGWLLLVALVVLGVAWLLPWQRRFTAYRIGAAVAAPFLVVVAVLVFASLVSWP